MSNLSLRKRFFNF